MTASTICPLFDLIEKATGSLTCFLEFFADGLESVPAQDGGIALLHGRGPPGFPLLAWNLNALGCFQPAFGAGL
jgi:hypothetical protein